MALHLRITKGKTRLKDWDVAKLNKGDIIHFRKEDISFLNDIDRTLYLSYIRTKK